MSKGKMFLAGYLYMQVMSLLPIESFLAFTFFFFALGWGGKQVLKFRPNSRKVGVGLGKTTLQSFGFLLIYVLLLTPIAHSA